MSKIRTPRYMTLLVGDWQRFLLRATLAPPSGARLARGAAPAIRLIAGINQVPRPPSSERPTPHLAPKNALNPLGAISRGGSGHSQADQCSSPTRCGWRGVRSFVATMATACAALLCFGCLADPPDYEAPARVPPVIAYSRVEPPTSAIVTLAPGQDRLWVNVPFRSEDLESDIVATFFFDAQPGSRSADRAHAPVIIPAATFDDLTRAVDVEITGLSELTGCHTLNLVMTHQNNFRFTGELIDEGMAVGVDWYLIAPRDGTEPSLEDCPTRGAQSAPEGAL